MGEAKTAPAVARAAGQGAAQAVLAALGSVAPAAAEVTEVPKSHGTPVIDSNPYL